jgi:diguanylate cyclase (GGDEF)-like protein
VQARAGRGAGRQAAVLLAAAGTITVLDAPLAGAAGGHPLALALIGVTAVVAGLVTWFLPWERWPDRSLLGLAALGLLLIAAGNYAGDADPYTYAIFFVVLFAWVGVTQQPWTPLLLAPAAFAAYVVPLQFSPLHRNAGWDSAFVVLPACVLVGETVARAMTELRRARHLDTRRVGDLEAIVGATALLQAETDPNEVGGAVARMATSILHGVQAVVLLQDGEGGRFTAGVHPAQLEDAPVRLPPLDAIEEALTTGQSVATDDTLVVPLRGASTVLGAVAVGYSDGHAADAFLLHAAQLFGAQAGLALEQQRVIDELTTAAMQDALTGVGNRRRAATLLEDLRPDDAVVLIDLDHFKLVNDTAGHAAGDRVLVLLGRYLREAARDADAIARYGGEEFLLVLRHAGRPAPAAVIRLLEGWRELKPLTTFSAGVAIHQEGRSPAATLGRADAALYRAKRTGRDRVCEDTAESTV